MHISALARLLTARLFTPEDQGRTFDEWGNPIGETLTPLGGGGFGGLFDPEDLYMTDEERDADHHPLPLSPSK